MDLAGLGRLFGDRRTIAAEVRRTAADRGLRVRVAMTDGRTAARLLVHQRPGLTVLDPGGDADALAPLPVEALHALVAGAVADEELAELMRTLRRWGVTTLGEFARCRPMTWLRASGSAACAGSVWRVGKISGRSCPAVPEERFEQALDLEWPIEGLEPLSFVLGRLLEPLSAHLERRDRGAAVLHVRLHLVTPGGARALAAAAGADARRAHAAHAAAARSRIASAGGGHRSRGRGGRSHAGSRGAVFAAHAPLPSPEQLSTLMARSAGADGRHALRRSPQRSTPGSPAPVR